jgi:hypothetical protein
VSAGAAGSKQASSFGDQPPKATAASSREEEEVIIDRSSLEIRLSTMTMLILVGRRFRWLKTTESDWNVQKCVRLRKIGGGGCGGRESRVESESKKARVRE